MGRRVVPDPRRWRLAAIGTVCLVAGLAALLYGKTGAPRHAQLLLLGGAALAALGLTVLHCARRMPFRIERSST